MPFLLLGELVDQSTKACRRVMQASQHVMQAGRRHMQPPELPQTSQKLAITILCMVYADSRKVQLDSLVVVYAPCPIPGCCAEDGRARGWLALCQRVERAEQTGLVQSVHSLQKHATVCTGQTHHLRGNTRFIAKTEV